MFGRRTLLLNGLVGLIFLDLLAGNALRTGQMEYLKYLLIAFMLCYSIGVGSVGWILLSEILPAKGLSFAITLDWVSFSLMSICYKPLSQRFGHHTMFYFFAGCNIFVLYKLS